MRAFKLAERLRTAGVVVQGSSEEDDVTDGSVDLNDIWHVQICHPNQYLLHYWKDSDTLAMAGSYSSVEQLVAAIKEKVR